MNLISYDLTSADNLLSFAFYSEGPKGRIKKIIQFRKLIVPDSQNDIYNLAFGDLNEKENKIDDLIVSDNKDSEKVLATIGSAVVLFTSAYPSTLIFAQGSTSSRTRYYTIGISKYFKEIDSFFEIWGFSDRDEWELYQKNTAYKALLVRRK